MRFKKLICSVLALALLLAVAGCGEIEIESSNIGNSEIDFSDATEVVFTPDTSEDISRDDIALAISVLELRLVGKNITLFDVSADNKNKQILVRFYSPSGDSEFDLFNTLEDLCERGVLAFCKNETQDEVILTGSDDVKSAKAGYDDAVDDYVVYLELTEAGGDKFAQATAELVGQKISIWLDDIMISAPTVQTAITGNVAVITGTGSLEEAEELANMINGGALPFRLSFEKNSIKIGR